jgi:hydrogenase maturation factor
MAEIPECCDGMTFCITCSDAADPMRVEAIDPANAIGRCIDAAGHRSNVLLDLVPDASVGVEVLVHAGVALCMLPHGPHAEHM